MSGQRNRSLSVESPIYTVPELMSIIRDIVIADLVPIKVRFSFIHESIAEMALFSVKLCAWFPPYVF
jgi:hypothetical protein